MSSLIQPPSLVQPYALPIATFKPVLDELASFSMRGILKASGKQSVAEVVQGHVQGDSVTPSVVFCCTV